MDEPWYTRVQREAGEQLEALLALPLANNRYELLGAEGNFDPWSLFPLLYGSYGSDFDECAIEVLTELAEGGKHRDDLGANMFREMLCNLNLCDYGTSPRYCFPTTEFKALLPRLVERWKEYSALQWGDDPS